MRRRMLTRHLGAVTRAALVPALLAALSTGSGAQQAAAPTAAPAAQAVPVARLVAEPASLSLRAGTMASFKVRAYDAAGREITNAFVRIQAGNRALRFADTTVVATAAGRFE